jgi:hypothetical protein
MAHDRDAERARPGDTERASAREEALTDERVRAAYRQPAAADELARERLLAKLAARARAPEATGLRWWFAASMFRARPAWVLATLVAVLAAGAWLGARLAVTRGPRARTDAAAASTGEGTAPVTFMLRAPGATRVSVVGDFNNWDAEATPMAHSGSGDLWVLNVRLPRGVHLYSFVLDGSEWRPDPSAPLAADGSFGAHNSVIVVDGAKGL